MCIRDRCGDGHAGCLLPAQRILYHSAFRRAGSACVLVGRCCDYILRDHPHCVKIFIHAPMEARVKRIMRLYQSVSYTHLSLSAGAGFIVALPGDIMTMPGLPKTPAANQIDVDADGNISGLF